MGSGAQRVGYRAKQPACRGSVLENPGTLCIGDLLPVPACLSKWILYMRAKPKLFFGWYIFCHPSLLMCDPHTLVEPGIAGPAALLLLLGPLAGFVFTLSVLGFHGRMVTSPPSSGLGGLAEWLAYPLSTRVWLGKAREVGVWVGQPAEGKL